MSWKKISAEYFNFTRRDRIAIMTILVLIMAVLIAPGYIARQNEEHPIETDTTLIALLNKNIVPDSFSVNEENETSIAFNYDRPDNKYSTKFKGELFYFDPNKITIDQWKRLGLREKTIQTIQKYLAKGGRFRKPEDLQRVYGLFPDEFERLAPYIQIAIDPTENIELQGSFAQRNYRAKKTNYNIVELNSADTSALITLPGIGSKLALRIINFRDKLGGFYSVNQIGETFGLADSTFQKIKPYLTIEQGSIRKININTVSVDELKSHPYIKWNLANPIISYRNEHGAFKNIGEIKNVMAVTDEIYQKIFPYLTL